MGRVIASETNPWQSGKVLNSNYIEIWKTTILIAAIVYCGVQQPRSGFI